MMKKVRNKKGFTLAELLVVLAILAILVAVAIPLFSGAVKDAQKTAREANVRAVRAAAVVEILTNDSVEKAGTKGWVATANISESGEMTGLKIEATDTAASITYPDGSNDSEASGKVDGEYKVPITDVKATS